MEAEVTCNPFLHQDSLSTSSHIGVVNSVPIVTGNRESLMQSCGAPPPPDAAAASVKMLHYCYSMMGTQHHPSSKRSPILLIQYCCRIDGWVSFSLSLSHTHSSMTQGDRQSICLGLSFYIENILRKREEFMRKVPFEKDGYSSAYLGPEPNL